jgi:hypothetical protein
MRTLTQTLTAVALLAMVGVAPVSAQDVSVDIAVARTIMDRMPVDEGNSFPVDVGEVWCWTRVSGGEGTTIKHVWLRDGVEMAEVPLNVSGNSWRTYSSKTIPPYWSGDWRVEVRDEIGNVLASRDFSVGAP